MYTRLILVLLFLTSIAGLSSTYASPPPAAAATGTTYTVTSTSCTGPGSITEVMDMANANPGTDTISITPGLQIDARECPPTDAPANPNDYYFLQATESVIFEGNGAKLIGSNTWINDEGDFIQSKRCHDDPKYHDLALSFSPGFIKVGVPEQDNSTITVTVRDLEFFNLSGLALVEKNASLVMEDARLRELVSSTRQCDQNIVKAKEGANVTLTGNHWYGNFVHSDVLFGTVFTGVIGSENAGNLTIKDSLFFANGNSGAISWDGQAGSEVNIVSTRFENSGGIAVSGAATSNIVNSIWASKILLNPDEDARTSNGSSEDMNIIASTFMFSNVACNAQCQSPELDGGVNLGWFVRSGEGNINFAQSAIEVATPDSKSIDETFVKLLDYNPSDPASGYSADAYTWIRPTALQDTDALKAVTGQPVLLTEQPAFRSPDITTTYNQWATPLVPGELIDRIEDAACGQSNRLLNPIDNSCITTDVLGNPRVDGNNKRNTGAVQIDLAPHLAVASIGDGMVDLSWTEPRVQGSVTGYELHYREKGAVDWTAIAISGKDTLAYQVTGLTNGTEYEFQVDSKQGSNPRGYPSNTVIAIPLGPIGAPTVTAIAGDRQVDLSWNKPSDGGHEIYSYHVHWRPVSTSNWIGGKVVTDTQTIVTGLEAGTEYEFAVSAYSLGGVHGPQGYASAMPFKVDLLYLPIIWR